jgi:hypothetical protein
VFSPIAQIAACATTPMTEERNAYRQIWTTVAAIPEGCVAT